MDDRNAGKPFGRGGAPARRDRTAPVPEGR